MAGGVALAQLALPAVLFVQAKAGQALWPV